jgi:hypothetical protein
MFSTKKSIEAIHSLSLIIIIIAVTSLDYRDISFENNKLCYFEMVISAFLFFIAFIIKLREIRSIFK